MLDDAAAEVVAPAHDASKAVPAHQLAFLASPAVWLCFAFFFLTTSAFGILQNYAPAILGNVYGVSLVLATAGLTAYLAGSAVGTITGGFIAARSEHNERVIAMALGLAAVMALLLASGWVSSSLLLPMMAIMGFGVGTAGPNRDLLVRRAATSQFGKASFGRVYGFVYSGLDTGLALSPLLFGPLLDAGRFNAALTAVAVLQAASLLTAMRVGVTARAKTVTTRGERMNPPMPTTDLCDANEGALADGSLRVFDPGLIALGGRVAFAGPAVTLKVFEDNSLIADAVKTPGEGRVLVVDAGGSRRCAVFGGNLAAAAASNGWAGVIINGCARDSGEIDAADVGVRALALHPRRSGEAGRGPARCPVTFLGVTVRPGEWIYADADGVLVSATALTA